MKGEEWRSLKKLLMGFSQFLLLGVYEFTLYLAVDEHGLLGSIPALSVKLFICSLFFILVFFQSAGFVSDSFLICFLFQLGLVVLLVFTDLLYLTGASGEDGYLLWLAFMVFAGAVLFIGKFFHVYLKRYETMIQTINKESLAEVCIIVSGIFLSAYFMMLGLLARKGILLGVVALLMLGCMHVMILKRWHFSRSGKKNYRIIKGESSGEEMIMDVQPIDDYKIIQRLILHFETRKPFLDSDLKLGDVSKQIYTNRTYLSRALNHRLSKNFNQFVNYYRVKEACRLYMENPMLKVSELAKMCGFKNLSSFSTSFSFNLRYTPAEWCKEVKRRMNNNEDVSIKDYFS